MIALMPKKGYWLSYPSSIRVAQERLQKQVRSHEFDRGSRLQAYLTRTRIELINSLLGPCLNRSLTRKRSHLMRIWRNQQQHLPGLSQQWKQITLRKRSLS